MSTITPREAEQVRRANASGRNPVVFVHGLWLLPNSWDNWSALFEERGFTALSPGWPDDPETFDEAIAKPEVFAGKTVGQIADHYEEVIHGLEKKPVIIGHSFGGLLTVILAGRGLASASVAISPAPFRGVLPLPLATLRSSMPVLKNPLNRGRAVRLTYKEFRYAFGNAVSDEESKRLYNTYSVAGPGRVLFQSALSNLNPFTEVKVDLKNAQRGPQLVVTADQDHTVAPPISKAAFKKEKHNEGVTEFKEFKGRGHSLTIDSGWRDVADLCLEFVGRFVKAPNQPAQVA